MVVTLPSNSSLASVSHFTTAAITTQQVVTIKSVRSVNWSR